jgi:hypothetical protein
MLKFDISYSVYISAPASENASRINKYHLGYSECAVEVSKYLERTNGLENDFRARLLNHLVEMSMTPSQDGENDYHAMKALNVPIESHPSPLHEDNSEYCQDTNKDKTRTIGSAGPYQETKQEKEINQNEDYVLRNKEADQAPANSTKGVQTNTARVPSGEMAYLVPAASILQYSGSVVSGSNVFLQLLQPQHSNSINTGISHINVTRALGGMSDNIGASKAMVTPFIPNMALVKQSLDPMCSFIQVMPKEFAHLQPPGSQSECAHIHPSDSQSDCAHIQPTKSQPDCTHIQPTNSQPDCAHIQPTDSQPVFDHAHLSGSQSGVSIDKDAADNVLQNKVEIQESKRDIDYEWDDCSISSNCVHEVKTSQVWRPW